jgi:hypothetical protein
MSHRVTLLVGQPSTKEQTMNDQPIQTASELRAMAKQRREDALRSFDECDTDGFLTQGCSNIMADLYETQAELIEQGGKDTFPALFDLDGNLVAAKLVETRYGPAWGLLTTDSPNSRITKFVSAYPKRKSTLERKGYREGTVLVAAYADLAGSHVSTVRPFIFRSDHGFSRDVEVVDDGR